MEEEEITFDMSIEDFLYQKFLLQICKICDDIYFTEKKLVEIPFDEKQKMAEEMLYFVAYALNNLKGPLIKVKKKSKSFDKRLKEYAEFLSKKAKKDKFSKFVLLRHTIENKIPVKKIPSYLTLATLVLLTKGRSLDTRRIGSRIKSVEPFTLRVASLVSPFIGLHERLREEVRKGNVKLESVLKEGKIDKETLRYIG